jgi:hypothetical protein
MPGGTAFGAGLKINTNDYSTDSQRMSQLVPITTSGKIYWAYEAVTADGAAVTDRRIYARNYTTAGASLSVHVDVSGADALGWSTPFYENHAGTHLCGYSKGDPLRDYPWNGFTIKESSDSGATWGSAYIGGGVYNNHALVALKSDGVRCLAITMSSFGVGVQTVTVHRRTGAGAWAATNIWSSAPGTGHQPGFDYWAPFSNPAQNLILQGTRAVFVSARHTEGQYALISQLQTLDFTLDATAVWTETIVSGNDPLPSGSSARRVLMALGSDGIIRMLYRGTAEGEVMASCKYSSDCGATWIDIGTPEAFYTLDSYQTQIYWPEVYEDLASFCLDGVNRWMISFPQRYVVGHMHRMMGSGLEAQYFGYLNTDNITNGAGLTWDYTQLTAYPASSCFYGTDWYRVVSAYDGVSRCQLWLLKSTTAGLAPGAGGGGRGIPTRRSEA